MLFQMCSWALARSWAPLARSSALKLSLYDLPGSNNREQVFQMPTNAQRSAPLRKLCGRVSGAWARLTKAGRRSSSRGATSDHSSLDSEANQAQGAGRPEHPIVQVTTLGKKPVEPGLAALWGWAYSGEGDFPEGTVEVALDNENEWFELSHRVPGGGDSGGEWN